MIPTIPILLALTLVGETTNPTNSLFARNERAEAVFTVRDIPAGQTLELKSWLQDENDRRLCDLRTLRVTGDADGRWTGRVELPTDRYGFYRLVASCGDARLPKVGSRRPDCLTYAVVFDPGKRKRHPEDESFYGFCGSGNVVDLNRWFGAWHQFGCASPLGPDQIAKALKRGEKPRRPTWGTIDVAIYPNHLEHFMTPEGRAYAAAHGVKSNRTWGFFDDAEGVGHFKAGVSNLVLAAREQVRGRRLYEVASEPDLTAPNPEVIVRQVRAAYEVISVLDPEGLVTAPVLSSFSKVALHRQLFDLGLADWITAFGIHQYTTYPPEENDILPRIRAIKTLIREKKGHDLPMFATEGGYCVPGETAKEIAQMNEMVRLQLILIGEGYSLSCMYYPFDCSREGPMTRHGSYGFMSNLDLETRRYSPHRVSPRPVAPALCAASRFTEGHRATGCLEGCFGETSLGYSYADRDDDCVIALWDWGKGSDAELPVGRDSVVVADIMGNERTVRTEKGVLRLELGRSVQYVLGPDPALWGLKGSEARRMQAETARRIAERESRREISLHSLSPKIGSTGYFAVRGEIENRLDEPVKACFRSRVRDRIDTGARTNVTLAPHETRIVEPYLANHFTTGPFEKVAVETSVEAPSGYVEFKSAEMNFFGMRNLGAGSDARPFAGWKEPAYADVPGSGANLAARIAAARTERHLLLDIVVDDDDFVAAPSGKMNWNGDAIQVGLAKGVLEKSSGNGLTDDYDEAMTLTTFALTEKGPEAWRTHTFDPKRVPTGPLSQEAYSFDIAKEMTAGGVRLHYRIAIPWQVLDLAAAPKRCESIRFAVAFCDRDGSEKLITHRLKLFEHHNAAPKGFGYLTVL